MDLPIDVEHSTQVCGPKGQPAPAVGWITDMEARDTGLWGKVTWNQDGASLLKDRAYKYISPVFSAATATGAITRMVSAGLTNNPNLDLVALNHVNTKQETPEMDKAVLEALDLNSDATAADVVVAIAALKTQKADALNRAEAP